MPRKPKRKMTLRGYQTALGIAKRRAIEANRRIFQLECDLVSERKVNDITTEELRRSREHEHHLRLVLGEPDTNGPRIKYKRVCLKQRLSNFEFKPIPPMHIHVTNELGYTDYGRVSVYSFDLHIPEYEYLDFRTASVIHKALHELVDFVEMKPGGSRTEVDTFTGDCHAAQA